jgi:RHS repeat-associated protein
LARSHGYSPSNGTWSTHNYYHADGGGNITALQNSSQSLVAQYRYDPFGRLLSSSGSLASANTYRFSSKQFHANPGLYYYGFRFYDPNAQRWINRDPIGEAGGINLFRFVGNDPVSRIDPLGLY